MWVGVIYVESGYMEIYDHEETLIDTIQNDGSGFSIQDIKTVARESVAGTQPSAYNQALLMDMATDNITIKREETGTGTS